MRYFDFNLGASPADRFNIESPGNYFFYRAASSAAQAIRLRAEKGGVDAVLLPGEGVRLPNGTGLWSLETWPAPGVAVNGSVVIGTGEFFSQRFSGTMDINGVSSISNGLLVASSPALDVMTSKLVALDNVGAQSGPVNAVGTAANLACYTIGPNSGAGFNFLILTKLRVQVPANATPSGLVISRLGPGHGFAAMGNAGTTGYGLYTNINDGAFGTRSGNVAPASLNYGSPSYTMWKTPLTTADTIYDVPLGPGMLLYTPYAVLVQQQVVGAALGFNIVECQGRFI